LRTLLERTSIAAAAALLFLRLVVLSSDFNGGGMGPRESLAAEDIFRT